MGDSIEHNPNAEDWSQFEKDIMDQSAKSEDQVEAQTPPKKVKRKKIRLQSTKMSTSALPVLEGRRESDADGVGSEENEDGRGDGDTNHGDEDSSDNTPPSNNAAALIPIRKKMMKRAESSYTPNSSSLAEDEDEDGSPGSKGRKKKRQDANTGTLQKPKSSLPRKNSKKVETDGSSLPPQLPPALPPPMGVSPNGTSNGLSSLPAPLPPPPSESDSSQHSVLPPPLPSTPPPRKNAISLVHSSSQPDLPKISAGQSPELDAPPLLLMPSVPDDILNLPSQRRTSLAMDGFSTLRDSLDEGTASPDGKRQRGLKRRQSTKSGSTGSIAKKTTSTRDPSKSRPTMMDGIFRIVKSSYDNKKGIDPLIFVMEAKEHPENVQYVEEDEEATEDYNPEFPAIKAATVEKLIFGLTPEAYTDPDYNFAFLLCYKSFLSAQQLVDLLTVRWNIPPPQKPSKTGVMIDAESFTKKKLIPVRLRIINVIKLWLEEHRRGIDADTRSVIEKFIQDVIAKDMPGPAASLTRSLNESGESKDEQIMFDEKPPKPYLPMNLKAKLSILDVHPEEIARQITLIDSRFYRKISPNEFLNSGWTRADKEVRSPGILAMISSFNVISQWVSTQILSQPDLKQRAITLNRIICIAQKCYEYNNFNGVMEILSSLHNSAIHRLYNTWEMLPQKSLDMFDNLSTLMNSNAGEGNFYLYRAALKKVVPPLVPYLGVYLTDLIFLNDGNKDYIDEGKKLVNFHKMTKIARVVRTIITHQQAPYCLSPVEFIQDYLTQGPFLTEDEQYAESCKLEKKIPKAQRTQAQNNRTIKKIKVDFKALNIDE